VQAPAAFLVTTATRLAINAIQSARARHETHVDSWHLSQSDTGADPALNAERSEALESAALLLLERLSPAERAAYVLREAVLLGKAWGISKEWTVHGLMVSAFYTGFEALYAVNAAVGDVLEAWV
jgi:hypothetical protein